MTAPPFAADPTTSLDEARSYINANCEEGVMCPCCEQRVQLYQRPITSAMAAALIYIYRHFKNAVDPDWLHVPSYLSRVASAVTRGGDWAKLRYWGLLDPKVEEREDGSSRNGYWKITPAGVEFSLGLISVPKYVYVYNGNIVDLSQHRVTVHDALGTKFDFNALMNG